MDTLITKLINQASRATARQLKQLTRRVAAAPFAEDLLEVDEPLWGGFWQGDVIAPGYRLPAVELALLRAVRLDDHWPAGTSVDQFLADLRRAILDPRAGVWTLVMAGQPCVVLAAGSEEGEAGSGERLITVVWYCAATGRLHAGYRAARGTVHFTGVIEQRGLEGEDRLKPSVGAEADWITQVVKQKITGGQHEVAARLDLEILQRRRGTPR
ncbi:MAG: hypothetical protein AB1801_06075 [Chloroflexota bacterium]